MLGSLFFSIFAANYGKMKKLIFNILVIFALALLGACGRKGDSQDQGRTYRVTGRFEADSLTVSDSLMLYADNHRSLRVDTIVLDAAHSFVSEFRTVGFDELYLCGNEGELCRFYATEGMEVAFSVSRSDDGLEARFEPTPTDSINAWMQVMDSLFSDQKESRRHEIMDSLVAARDTSLRPALLLRDHLMEFEDSVYVRRLLGGLVASAKPEWLMKSIEHLLDEKSALKDRSRRYKAVSFDMKNDSVLFNFGDSRTDYLLVCFWADFSPESADSLKMLSKLLKENYAEKRLQLVTCCLHASDSAWWTGQLADMPGRHTWVKGGFSDPRISDWNIQQVPSVLLLDMYNNQQQRNAWGEKLRKSLDRIPKKYNNTK